MTCPGCRAEMTPQTLEGHLGTSVTIDVCLPCQVFWFDSGESLKLSPAGVLALFRMIGEHPWTARPADASRPACPRCDVRLFLTHDQQRNTKFEYLRCPKGHGRLTTFMNFLREKNFIKPLSPQEVEQLRQGVQTVSCSNCGAPIDLATSSTCTHCGSALSMLDMKQAGALIAELRAASPPKAINPALPLELERARREVDAAFASFECGPSWFEEVSSSGLVGAGLSALGRWLKQQG
jgi:Zn-finger nucleic acid-binding protein